MNPTTYDLFMNKNTILLNLLAASKKNNDLPTNITLSMISIAVEESVLLVNIDFLLDSILSL